MAAKDSLVSPLISPHSSRSFVPLRSSESKKNLEIAHHPNWRMHEDRCILKMVVIQNVNSQTPNLQHRVSNSNRRSFRPDAFGTAVPNVNSQTFKCQTSNLKSRNLTCFPFEAARASLRSRM